MICVHLFDDNFYDNFFLLVKNKKEREKGKESKNIQVSFVIHYIPVKLKGAKLMVTSGINGVQIQTDSN